jgi:5-formyltetrahydrofolate cyclo-ligase
MIKNQKKILRDAFRKILRSLPIERRKAAEKEVSSLLLAKVKPFKKILSFASSPLEINLWPFNRQLAKEGRLILPKIEQTDLLPFLVTDIEKELLLHPKFSFLEPNSLLCKTIDPEEIDCVLLPALAFDKNHFRLGYGLGYYDRFLQKTKKAHKIGVGYQEQLFFDLLPREPHDIHVDELLLL